MRAAIYDAEGAMVVIVTASRESVQMNADALGGTWAEIPDDWHHDFTSADELEWSKTPPGVWPDGTRMTYEEQYGSPEPENVV